MQNIKLCGIYICWDDWDWLKLNLKNSFKWLDGIIVVWSSQSNFGEYSPRPESFHKKYPFAKFIQFEPDLKNTPQQNETLKRNIGLDWARKTDYTHFLMMDADEFYSWYEIQEAKFQIEMISDFEGFVCQTKTYFKSPSLTIGDEGTLVPFIHKLDSKFQFGMNYQYPFAWSMHNGIQFTEKKKIRIDPTRQLIGCNPENIIWSEATMQHYSWVRKDIKKKINNSTAKMNLVRSSILKDYVQAKEGYFCEFYKKRLEACPNIFGLPEIIDENISI